MFPQATLRRTFSLVWGYLISKAETASSPAQVSSHLMSVWNRVVVCRHCTWLKNVRNVELYSPPSFLSSFLFLHSASGRGGATGSLDFLRWSVVLQGAGGQLGCGYK